MAKISGIMRPVVPTQQRKVVAQKGKAGKEATKKKSAQATKRGKATKKVVKPKTGKKSVKASAKKAVQKPAKTPGGQRKVVKPMPKAKPSAAAKKAKVAPAKASLPVGQPMLPSATNTLHYIAGLLAHRHMTPHERRTAESLYDMLRSEKHHDEERMKHYESRLTGVEGALPAFHAIRGRSDEADEQASAHASGKSKRRKEPA